MTVFLQFLICYIILGVILASYISFVLSQPKDEFLKNHSQFSSEKDLEQYNIVKDAYDKRSKYLSFTYSVILSPIMLTWILISSIIGVVKAKRWGG